MKDSNDELNELSENNNAEDLTNPTEENQAEDLSFEDSSFDIVVSMNAFHNYAEQDKALDQIKRVLKPGWVLVFAGLEQGWSFQFDKLRDQADSA